MTKLIDIEVAYAEPDKQKIVQLSVAEGTTVKEAALQSGLETDFPHLNIEEAKLGVFGKTIAKPDAEQVQVGDRIEIYRPLIIDPKQARLNRAAKKNKT